MKKSDNTHKRTIPSGGEEEESHTTRADRAETVATTPGSSVAKKIVTYQVRLAPAISPPDSLTVSLPSPANGQGELPSNSTDGQEVYIPCTEEAGIPPVPGKNQVRLAPATSPPDASTVSLPLPSHQLGEFPSTSADEQEVYIPGTDEEEAGIPPVLDTDQGISTSDAPLPTGASATQDEVFSAYLAPTPEERRRRMLENAVTATNVHVIEPTVKHKKWSRRKKAAVALCVIIAAAIGVSLGVTLSRRDDPTRFDQVAALVESLFNTTLHNASSPEYQAAQWMANDDMVFDDLAAGDPDRFRQRYALAVFYFATGGPTSWIETSFFLKPDTHECEWQGAPLPETQTWVGSIGVVNCTSDQWVQGIEINQNNLTGTLPQELGSLTSLTDFVVFGNSIGGTLPPSLFQLRNLHQLVLWANEITGTIPTGIGEATSLLSLNLHFNSLRGTIPTEIGNMSSLGALSLGLNFFNGSIPETLQQLSNLYHLEFGINAFTGSLPMSLSSSWPHLESFGIYDNLLTGTIPNDLDSLSHLEHLELAGNQFTGPFPSSIVALTNVTWFSVSMNYLTGSLPNDWNNLSGTLDHLVLGENQLITGTLPESLGNLSLLEFLQVHINEFHGTIPASLGNLTRLQALYLFANDFYGTVPESFVRLTSLRQLSLHRNRLTGDISFLCNGTEMLLPHVFYIGSDCFEEIDCPCCSFCCARNNTCRDV